MGVNLIPSVSNFNISREMFDNGNASVKLGCAPVGQHRIMTFDLYCNNRGNKDLVVGRPEDRPDIFERSEIFGWQFKEKFYTYDLKNDSGLVRSGYKVAFCLLGGRSADGRNFDCSYQGIAAGNRDLYNAGLPCQFIIIDDVPDGDYTWEATANASRVVEEDNYDDNTVKVRLQINGDSPPRVIG
jgi:hypothetical protein